MLRPYLFEELRVMWGGDPLIAVRKGEKRRVCSANRHSVCLSDDAKGDVAEITYSEFFYDCEWENGNACAVETDIYPYTQIQLFDACKGRKVLLGENEYVQELREIVGTSEAAVWLRAEKGLEGLYQYLFLSYSAKWEDGEDFGVTRAQSMSSQKVIRENKMNENINKIGPA